MNIKQLENTIVKALDQEIDMANNVGLYEDTYYDANTYYKLTKQGLREIIFAFVFNDNHPSETEQVEFAKDFDTFFKINTFRFNSVKEETKAREDKLVCYQNINGLL